MAGKLPKNRRAGQREIERVVEKALKKIDRYEDNREAVNAMFDVILHQLIRNRGLEAAQVLAKTDAVVRAISNNYGALPEEFKGWDALVAFAYLQYHLELDISTEMFGSG